MTPADDTYFTNGVRVMYRAYAAEEHVSVFKDSTKQCGIHAKVADVFWYPHKNRKEGIMVDGMKILTAMPNQRPAPYPFVPGSRALLDGVMVKVETELKSIQGGFEINNRFQFFIQKYFFLTFSSFF